MENTESNTHKNKMNKTWLLVAVLVILTAILLIVSLTAKNSLKNPTKSQESMKDIAKTSLFFSEEIRPGVNSGTYEVDINIDSQDNKVTFAQLEMSYDPNLINILDIQPGNFFSNPDIKQKNISTTDGRIKFWSGIRPNEIGKKGSGTVAVITFSKIGSAPAQINFLPKTSIQSSETNQSVLKDMVSGFIDITPTQSSQPNSPTQAFTQ